MSTGGAPPSRRGEGPCTPYLGSRSTPDVLTTVVLCPTLQGAAELMGATA